MDAVIHQWEAHFGHLHEQIGQRFRRAEPRQRALGYLRALLSPCERKNGWQLAELLGEPNPDGIQRLLNAADWDAEAVRDDLRAYVVDHLGDAEAVLIVDETGFLKKGTHSVGVKRQYSGTAGRVENCQIGVFLGYASSSGAAFLDRALYLPKEWAAALPRRQAAGVPETVTFATKPQLARQMLERAFEAGVPRRWVTADTIYGGDRRLRRWLEEQGQPFVLAVPCNEPLWWHGPRDVRADQIAGSLPQDAWRRLSAGDGAKGPRVYDWAWTPLWRFQPLPEDQAWGHGLLVRRSLSDPTEMAYYVVFAPRDSTGLEDVVGVAGTRWQIEVGVEAAKNDCGLDEYEVRKWHAWYRHVTLALLAHAFLVVMRNVGKKRDAASGTDPTHGP
ncbi:MAG TPA: IS701 family transposase [Candidatus Entotheonella sp.]|jgi:SRSO17 transposase